MPPLPPGSHTHGEPSFTISVSTDVPNGNNSTTTYTSSLVNGEGNGPNKAVYEVTTKTTNSVGEEVTESIQKAERDTRENSAQLTVTRDRQVLVGLDEIDNERDSKLLGSNCLGAIKAEFQDPKKSQKSITVQDIRGKCHVFEEIDDKMRVRDFQEKVYKKTTILPEQQRLTYGGKTMETGKTLRHYNMDNGSKVHMTTNCRGG